MDLEKQLEIQRKETSSALRIMLGYADKLAAKNLDKNRESLEQLKRFSLNMAQFFCVEGHEHGCEERIMEKDVLLPSQRNIVHFRRKESLAQISNIRTK